MDTTALVNIHEHISAVFYPRLSTSCPFSPPVATFVYDPSIHVNGADGIEVFKFDRSVILSPIFGPSLRLLVQRYATRHEENADNLGKSRDLTQDNDSNKSRRGWQQR